MFTTDGTAHKNGIKNEKRIQEKFESSPLLFGLNVLYGPLKEVIKAGGTQNKADLILKYEKAKLPLSIKNFTGATHDWINTTKVPNIYFEAAVNWTNDNRGTCSDIAAQYSKKSSEGQKIKKQKESELKEIINACFDLIPSKFLKDFLAIEFSKIAPQHVLLADKISDTDYLYAGKDHPIFQLLEDENAFFTLRQKRNAKTSRSIFCNGKDTGLRLRVVLNNGMGALLAGKLWSSNSTSCLTIKLQQESPLSIVKDLDKKGLIRMEKK